MANEMVPQQPAFSEMERLAEAVARSGMFGMKTKEQALVLMAISQAEGRHPALAARDYDIIQNRPAKKAEAMLRDFIQGGGKCEWHALTDEIADATFSHPSGGIVRIAWDLARAAKAGLGGKDNWKKFPRQMLRSRTVSEGVRTVYPLATSGFYVPEEAADMPATTGPTIEAKAEPAHDDRDALNASIPLKETAPPNGGGKQPKFADWFAGIEVDLAQAQSTAGVEAIKAREKVQQVLAAALEGKVQAERAGRVQALLDAAHERVFETPQAGVAPFEPEGAEAGADTGATP